LTAFHFDQRRLSLFSPARNCKKLQVDVREMAIVGTPPGAGSLPQWIAPNGYQWFVSQIMVTMIQLGGIGWRGG
jgi:hypothetical protein